MKNNKYLLVLFFFKFISLFGQETLEINNDSIRDIETVYIDPKDYEKVAYSFALKKEINSRLASVNPNVEYEIGLRFKNNLEKRGKISDVTLYLHKTNSEDALADIELNFYEFDQQTNKPSKRINEYPIIYTPKTKKRNNVKINIEKFRLPFPETGVVVTVKWLPTKDKAKRVGPAVRFTNYTEKLTYTRYNNDDSKWGNDLNFSKKNDKYTNVMIGLDVYFKKKKTDE